MSDKKREEETQKLIEQGKIEQEKQRQIIQQHQQTNKSNQIIKEGWLVKQGGSYKNWKKRWFILRSNCLTYHKR